MRPAPALCNKHDRCPSSHHTKLLQTVTLSEKKQETSTLFNDHKGETQGSSPESHSVSVLTVGMDVA